MSVQPYRRIRSAVFGGLTDERGFWFRMAEWFGEPQALTFVGKVDDLRRRSECCSVGGPAVLGKPFRFASGVHNL